MHPAAAQISGCIVLLLVVWAGPLRAELALKPVRDFEFGDRLSLFVLSPTAALVATVKDVGHVEVWDARSGELRWKHDERDANPTPVFSPAGDLLAFWSGGAIGLRDAVDGDVIARLEGPSSPAPGNLQFSADGRWLVSHHDGRFAIHDVEAARRAGDGVKPLQVVEPENPRPDVNPIVVRQMLISSDSARLLVLTQWALHEWALPSAERLRTRVTRVQRLDPTGSYGIDCQSPHGLYRMDDLPDMGVLNAENVSSDSTLGLDLPMREGRYGRIDSHTCRFAPDGTLVTQWSRYAEQREFDLYVWETDTTLRYAVPASGDEPPIPERIVAAEFTADNRHLITIDSGKTLRIFDNASGALAADNADRKGLAWDRSATSDTWSEQSLSIDRSGRYFLTWGNFSDRMVPGFVRLWELDDGTAPPAPPARARSGSFGSPLPWIFGVLVLLVGLGIVQAGKRR